MDNSPMAKLPLELRMDIYERVLHSEDGHKVNLNKPKHRNSKKAIKSVHPLAIRATCREIYQETHDIVFKVNDSWRIHYRDSKTPITGWKERLDKWCESAGARCLGNTRALDLYLGTWKIRPDSAGGVSEDVRYEAIEIWSHLPKSLRRFEIETTLTLHLDWTSGIQLYSGAIQDFPPFTLCEPMWHCDKHPTPLGARTLWALSEYRDAASEFFRMYRDSWRDGVGDLPPFCDPVDYNVEGPRIYEESHRLERCAKRIAVDMASHFHESLWQDNADALDGAVWSVDYIYVD